MIDLVATLKAAGFEPPFNICAVCHHSGADHDLNNWCLVCPRPEVNKALERIKPFTARSEAGWCFFSSMSDAERWEYGVSVLEASSAARDTLDVDRLADALLAWSGASPLDPTFTVTASPREMARAIAAEYERLAVPR